MFTDERNMFNDERNVFNGLDSLIIDEGRVGEMTFPSNSRTVILMMAFVASMLAALPRACLATSLVSILNLI